MKTIDLDKILPFFQLNKQANEEVNVGDSER